MTATKRFLLSLLSFSFLVVSVCPFFAYAAESYYVPFSQPQVTENSGYIEVLFEQSDGDRYIRVFQWQTTVGSDWTELDLPVPLFLTVNSNGFIKFQFEANPESVFYSVITIYDPYYDTDVHFNVWQNLSSEGIVTRSLDYDDDIVSFNIYGSYAQFSSDLTNSYLPAFTVSYGDDTSLSDVMESLAVINANLLQLHNDNVITQEELISISSKLNELYTLLSNDLGYIKTYIYEISDSLLYIINQLNAFSDRMHKDITDVYAALEAILTLVRDYFPLIDEDLLMILDENIAMNEKLDRIIEILEMQGESVQTTVDSSNIDEAIDIENSLLDNSNVDVSDVINVEVNQNALTVIWDLVEKFLNSHGKVFGMVLTVLSLGLVAMILGRKV